MKPSTLRNVLFQGLLALALAPIALHAQEAPVVKSFKILETLTTKDIVLDGANRPSRPVAIDLQVQFSFNSADLLPQGRQQLDELAMALNDRSLLGEGFEVIGHTDRVGSAEYNQKLSLERASIVKSYLITSHGVSALRLRTMGMGYNQLADTANPGAAINRRVEIRRVNRGAGTPAPDTLAPATGGRMVPTPQ